MAIFLTIVLFVLQLLDTYTTTTIDDLDGVKNNDERNVLMRWLFEQFGRNTVLNIKTIMVTAVGYFIGSSTYLVGDVVVDGLWIELAVVLVYVYVVFFYNWRSMPKES